MPDIRAKYPNVLIDGDISLTEEVTITYTITDPDNCPVQAVVLSSSNTSTPSTITFTDSGDTPFTVENCAVNFSHINIKGASLYVEGSAECELGQNTVISNAQYALRVLDNAKCYMRDNAKVSASIVAVSVGNKGELEISGTSRCELEHNTGAQALNVRKVLLLSNINSQHNMDEPKVTIKEQATIDSAGEWCNAGVEIQAGNLIMEGGTIQNCKTSYGGVLVSNTVNNGGFTMNGGTITGNSADWIGRADDGTESLLAAGGVTVQAGKFTMLGGEIKGNTNDLGYGQGVSLSGIKNNDSSWKNGSFYIGNDAVVGEWCFDELSASGGPSGCIQERLIDGNDVYLYEHSNIYIDQNLTKPVACQITMPPNYIALQLSNNNDVKVLTEAIDSTKIRDNYDKFRLTASNGTRSGTSYLAKLMWYVDETGNVVAATTADNAIYWNNGDPNNASLQVTGLEGYALWTLYTSIQNQSSTGYFATANNSTGYSTVNPSHPVYLILQKQLEGGGYKTVATAEFTPEEMR